jgi:hypothetical protein
MKSMRELIELFEGKSQGTAEPLAHSVNATLPGVYVIPQLRNTDTYMQYRYGLALAGARAKAEHDIDFEQESAWAENFAIVTYTPEDEETIRLADAMMGVTATRIASQPSTETDVDTKSPVAARKKNKYGV